MQTKHNEANMKEKRRRSILRHHPVSLTSNSKGRTTTGLPVLILFIFNYFAVANKRNEKFRTAEFYLFSQAYLFQFALIFRHYISFFLFGLSSSANRCGLRMNCASIYEYGMTIMQWNRYIWSSATSKWITNLQYNLYTIFIKWRLVSSIQR